MTLAGIDGGWSSVVSGDRCADRVLRILRPSVRKISSKESTNWLPRSRTNARVSRLRSGWRGIRLRSAWVVQGWVVSGHPRPSFGHPHAAGEADALSGCYLAVDDDLEKLTQESDGPRSHDQRKLRLTPDVGS